MLRWIDGLLAGGLVAGVIWYTRREQRKAEAEADTAGRLAKLAAGRVQLARAVAMGDGAIAAGNAATGRAQLPVAGNAEAGRAQLADAIAIGDRAIAAGNAAAGRTQLAQAVATGDRAIAAGNAAAGRTQLAQAVATGDRAIAAGNAAAASRTKAGGLTRQFDHLFALHGRGIPVPYLRALAQAESGMRPNDPLGLINVVSIALADYNRRHPSAPITAEQMRDPASNVRVAADILRTMIESFQRHHSDVPNMVEDWSNRRFVELITFAWNAGHSELAGVGRVVGFLKTPPIVVRPADITIDSVFDAAWQARAKQHLYNRRKSDYSKGVAAAYVREVERDARDRGSPTT